MIVEATRRFVEANRLFRSSDRILVGASGGCDSMVLVDVLKRLGFSMEAVHVNYGLRGRESEDDAALVRNTCAQLAMPLREVDATEAIRSRRFSGSLQTRARELRYQEFARLAEEGSFDCVAVAHHLDDQVETVLTNALRRSGLDGLAGMKPKRRLLRGHRVALVRPFLALRRADIAGYAEREGVAWRQDRSNADRRFLRARLRHETIPALLRAAGDEVIDDLLSMSAELGRLVDDVLPNLLPDSIRPERIRDGFVPTEPLLDLDSEARAWLYLRILRALLPGVPARRSTIEALEKLSAGRVGSRLQYDAGSVWRERDGLRFRPMAAVISAEAERQLPSSIALNGGENVIEGTFGVLSWNAVSGLPAGSEARTSEIFVDAEKISGGLVVRTWEPGDRLQPFGMSGTKKVKSLLTDHRVPTSERGAVHVLCDEERIVWVLGLRMSEHYRVTSRTKRILRFSLKRETRN